MQRIALIGGTGSERLTGIDAQPVPTGETPFGSPSGNLLRWSPDTDHEFLFLPRHGEDGSIPPHRVNYRANLWVLREHSVDAVIGINAVGGIDDRCTPGSLVLPKQLIDYTWGREHTFAGEPGFGRLHAEFTQPICPRLHAILQTAAGEQESLIPTGVYGVTQGPRLETAAEIDRLARDGCTIVGMTAMPEAGLAAELQLPYAVCAAVVNRAAGRGDGRALQAQIETCLHIAMERVGGVIRKLPGALAGNAWK